MMWLWIVVLGVLIGLGSVCCRVTVRPQNTVAIRDEWTSLECRTTAGSAVRVWSVIPSSNRTKSDTIFSNWFPPPKIIIPRFGVDVDGSGSGILYTNETRFSDGGQYTCSVFVGEETAIADFSAELIVLESKPVCSVRKYDSRNIKTECSVGFSGNWAPRMEWRHHSSRREAHENGTLFTDVTADSTNGTHVTSKLNVVILNNLARESLSVSCKIFFDARDHIFPNGSATNVPDFVRIWTSPVFGPTDFPPDVDASPTTRGLDVISNTLSDQSTDDVTRFTVSLDMESKNDKEWTIILIGAVIFVILVISLLSGAIICIIRKKKTNNQCRRNVDVTCKRKSTRASDPNIYASIILCDDDGYRIPQLDSIDGNSPIESFCAGSLDPYYVTTLTKQSTNSLEAEKIGRSRQMNEANATSTDYEKMSRLPKDNAKVPKQQNFNSSKLSEANYTEAETEKTADYLQVICDSEDRQCGERGSSSSSSSSSRQPSAISPNAAYTRLML